MIKRITQLEDHFSVGRATALIAVLTFGSRIMGFLRELLFAKTFGAGDALDVYYTAFRIPDTIYNLLILGTLSVAFIPVYHGYYLKDKQRANRLANNIMTIALLVMAVICVILFIFAEPLTQIIAPGFTGEKFSSTVSLTRIILVSPVLFTLSSVLTSVLNAHKKFLVFSLAPIFYNLGIIFGLYVFYPRFGLTGLGLGVILGALLHILVQLPQALRYFSIRPIIDLADSGVKQVGKLFIPRILGLDISYISLIIASMIGSVLPAGSIAVFNLANNLQTVALGVFALSTAAAVFPVLTESFANEDQDNFTSTIKRSIIRILFFIVPVSLLILILRAHIVRLAYGYGQFDWEDTILTFRTLGVMVFALASQSLIPLLARAFYARHNTKTPLIISLIAMVINAGVSYAYAQTFGVVGIAVGFTVASIFNCLALFATLRVELEGKKDLLHGLAEPLGKIILASIVMGMISYGSLYVTAMVVDTRTIAGIFIQTLAAGSLGAITYLLLTNNLGIKEASSIGKIFSKF
jgi:putative peptidoglycan lipid II flippase